LEARFNKAEGIEKIEIGLQLSETYMDRDLGKSLNYAEKALELSNKTKLSPKLESQLYNTLGAIHFFMSNYAKSVKYYEDGLPATIKTSSNNDIAKAYYNIALLYDKTGKRQKAESNFEKSIEFAKKASNKEVLSYCYRSLSILNELNGNYVKATNYLKQYVKIKDIAFSETQNILRSEISKEKQLREEKEIQVKDLELDTLEKSEEIKVLNYEKALAAKDMQIKEQQIKIQESEIESEKMKNYVLFGFIILVILIGLVILRSYFQKKKTNKLLVNKNFEIQQQKEEIETQNGMLLEQKSKIEESHLQITDSINYAKRIQSALLNIEIPIETLFKEYFIYYKPRDIVSGDFYWIEKIHNKIVVVAADCTGHGVPGAFMSMLGISLLNELTTSDRIETPGEILNELRNKVKIYLRQTGKMEENKDGMDMAMVIIDTDTWSAKFSGANNPIYIIRDHQFMEYKPTRNPIGIYLNELPFKTEEIQLQKNDSLYLFSDGYIDQFGGEKGVRLKSSKFRELLLSICEKPMTEQHILLEEAYCQWKGNHEQVDDILILGLKIK
jgi:serine phosphatase RsbU (regulator of sigma subunit)